MLRVGLALNLIVVNFLNKCARKDFFIIPDEFFPPLRFREIVAPHAKITG